MLYDPNWKPAEVEIKLEPWQNLLLDAAKVIEQRGWCQDRFENAEGEVCLMGAIQVAQYGCTAKDIQTARFISDFSGSAGLKARVALYRATGSIGIANWNDSQSHTKEEVAAKLREAVNVL